MTRLLRILGMRNLNRCPLVLNLLCSYSKKSLNSMAIYLCTILKHNNRSVLNRLNSNVGKSQATRRSLYDRSLRPYSFFIKDLCTFSIRSISESLYGDQIGEQYSNIGITYTLNAKILSFMSQFLNALIKRKRR